MWWLCRFSHAQHGSSHGIVVLLGAAVTESEKDIGCRAGSLLFSVCPIRVARSQSPTGRRVLRAGPEAMWNRSKLGGTRNRWTKLNPRHRSLPVGRLAQPGQSDWLRTSLSGVRIPQRPYCPRATASDTKGSCGFERGASASDRGSTPLPGSGGWRRTAVGSRLDSPDRGGTGSADRQQRDERRTRPR